MATSVPALPTPNQIGRIHLKSQAIVNLFFGIPMVALVLPFWGLPLSATIKVTTIYLIVYAVFFVPMWWALPHILMRRIQPVLRGFTPDAIPDDIKLKHAVEFLLDYPLHSSVRQYFFIIIGFIAGSLLIPLGAVSELMPIQPLAITYVLVIGLVVSLIESFLNFTFLENYMAGSISAIVAVRPILAVEQFENRRISLLKKMLFVILGSVFAAQAIIFVFVIGKFAISLSDSVGPAVAYLGAFMALTACYVVVAAILFTRNISRPLRMLIEWSGRVAGGDRSKLALITNDEINDVARYSNQMVSALGNLSAWLERERDQLAAEKDKLSSILSNVADGVLATDQQGAIVLFNHAMVSITGWREKDALGKSVHSVIRTYDDTNRPVSITEQPAPKRRSAASERLNVRLVTRDQQNKHVVISTTTMPASADPQIKSIFTFHDVTDEKELERMKLDFVSMAAHELRTPLTSIRGYLDILSAEMQSKMDSQEQTFMNRAIIGANQLSTLIENLLNVSRIERGGLKLDVAPISVKRLIDSTVETLQDIAAHNQITIITDADSAGERLVMADHFRIGEVINNLVGNAISYSPAGTTISVSVTIDNRADLAKISVADQGYGIPAEATSHLFTKFYRVAGDLSQGSKGTGLGLFISKAIVEAHKGKIWVDSVVGKGSVFSFTLPLAPADAVEKQFAVPSGPPKLQSSGGSTNHIN
jgi:PAS domain S-box-containing protein